MLSFISACPYDPILVEYIFVLCIIQVGEVLNNKKIGAMCQKPVCIRTLKVQLKTVPATQYWKALTTS